MRLVGVGWRSELAAWLSTRPAAVGCLEVTAEHFFDGGLDLLRELSARVPLMVHGLGASLGTPGPLDREHLRAVKRVVDAARPLWLSEHAAFTRTSAVDLGHLNPVAPTRRNLEVMAEHARELSDFCGVPLLLENIASHLRLEGDMPESEFLNELCARAGCGLLLDAANLYVNARNFGFDPLVWLDALDCGRIRQLHVVGYSARDGVLHDLHAADVQDEVFALVEAIAARAPRLRAAIIERDQRFGPAARLESDLRRLEEALSGIPARA